MSKAVRAIFFVSILGTWMSHPVTAQTMGGAMQPSPYPERRPTDMSDPAATSGDRHDVDGDPWAKRDVHISPAVGTALKALLKAAEQKDWTTANAKLKEARAIPNASEFDRFEIDVMASFVALNTGDHATVLASYQRVIASPFFSTAEKPLEQSATLKNAMILSNEAGDFSGAIAYGVRLAAMGPIDEASAIALAMAYFGNRDYATARSLAQKAVDAAVGSNKKPDDVALQIVTKSSANLH